MERLCDSCGRAYEAKRRTSRWCSDTCRVRGSRGAVRVVPPPDEEPPASGGQVSAAVRCELESADRLESAAGQAALALAARIDAGRDTGSALAALVKEMRATLAQATQGAAVEESALDRLRRLRAERLGRGA